MRGNDFGDDFLEAVPVFAAALWPQYHHCRLSQCCEPRRAPLAVYYSIFVIGVVEWVAYLLQVKVFRFVRKEIEYGKLPQIAWGVIADYCVDYHLTTRHQKV